MTDSEAKRATICCSRMGAERIITYKYRKVKKSDGAVKTSASLLSLLGTGPGSWFESGCGQSMEGILEAGEGASTVKVPSSKVLKLQLLL